MSNTLIRVGKCETCGIDLHVDEHGKPKTLAAALVELAEDWCGGHAVDESKSRGKNRCADELLTLLKDYVG